MTSLISQGGGGMLTSQFILSLSSLLHLLLYNLTSWDLLLMGHGKALNDQAQIQRGLMFCSIILLTTRVARISLCIQNTQMFVQEDIKSYL
jgi:hypothetical protein